MDLIEQALGRPRPFEPHDAPFWDDPHISTQMLEAHLDTGTDAASRRPETIRATVEHLSVSLALGPGTRLLDLGCGPGLYAEQFAARGITVSGVDLSRRSIEHAREHARLAGLGIEYRLADYTSDNLGGPFDAAVLIYLDFGVLPDAERDRLLDAVRCALGPGGRFAFDVYTPARARVPDGRIEVSRLEHGFWRPHPHLLVETTYRYDGEIDLNQYAVLDQDGVTTYRVWDRAYAAADLRRLLRRHGFTVEERWADLTGSAWYRFSPTAAVVARKQRS